MKKIELKAKKFAKRYIANNFNGTKTALELYDTKDKNVAHVIASENLLKPTFINAIEKELEAHGITAEKLDVELSKVIEQDKHLPSKVSAIQEGNKLLKRNEKEPQKHLHLHINVNDPEAVENRIKELQSELRALTTQD